jgi:hypothetical protein
VALGSLKRLAHQLVTVEAQKHAVTHQENCVGQDQQALNDWSHPLSIQDSSEIADVSYFDCLKPIPRLEDQVNTEN